MYSEGLDIARFLGSDLVSEQGAECQIEIIKKGAELKKVNPVCRIHPFQLGYAFEISGILAFDILAVIAGS